MDTDERNVLRTAYASLAFVHDETRDGDLGKTQVRVIGEKGVCHVSWCLECEPRERHVRRVGPPLDRVPSRGERLTQRAVQVEQGWARANAGPEHARPALRRKATDARDRETERGDGDAGHVALESRHLRGGDVAEEVQREVQLTFLDRSDPIARRGPEASQRLAGGLGKIDRQKDAGHGGGLWRSHAFRSEVPQQFRKIRHALNHVVSAGLKHAGRVYGKPLLEFLRWQGFSFCKREPEQVARA